MPYDVKNMSDRSLELLILVMEDMLDKRELNPSSPLFEAGPVKGVEDSMTRQIIWGLKAEGCLGSDFGASYMKEPFFVLHQAAHDELHHRYHDKKESPSKLPNNQKNKFRFIPDHGIMIQGELILIGKGTNAYNVLDFIYIQR